MQQLQGQPFPFTIGILDQLVDRQPPLGVQLHAHNLRLMPKHEAEKLAGRREVLHKTANQSPLE